MQVNRSETMHSIKLQREEAEIPENNDTKGMNAELTRA